MQSVMLHSVLGPLGVYFAFMSATNLDAIRDTIVAHPASTVDEQCTIFSYTSIIGSVFGHVFGSWAFFQLSWLLLGWQSGIENWVHHLLFTGVYLVNAYSFVLGETILFAVAMEVSSPPLRP